MMEMSKPSEKMIKALQSDLPDKSGVSESTIIGVTPDSPNEETLSSVTLLTLNHKDELMVMMFMNANEVTEFCAALQTASDAVFGDMQAMVELPN